MDMAISAKRANKNLSVISVLVDQAPEAISFYKAQVGGENVLFTTYEDSPERQMFIAEFALKRAKRYAETGRDVLLIIDSLNALSRAFNETDASIGGKTLAGGLESKTIQYLKRYFGTARCLEDGGSLTIIGALSVATGNPADDLLRAELAPVSNLEIVMSEDLAKRRIFPPIDLFETRGKRTSATSGLREGITNDLIRSDYLSAFSTEDLYKIIRDAENFQDMENKVFKQLKTKNK
jgi:transcription termination factor Rho